MLNQQIREDMKNAMRAKDDLSTQTLRGSLAAFTNELVAKGRKPTEELNEQEMIAVLKRLVKQRKEAAEQYKTGNRPELAEKEISESKILEAYLPASVPRDEILKVAEAKKAELGVTDKAGAGKLMGAIIKHFALAGQAGAADGAVVKEVVSTLLP